jgi:hypothetical protein
MKKILLRTDLYFEVEGEIETLDIALLKKVLIHELVSEYRSNNWGSKKYEPLTKTKSLFRQSGIPRPAILLLHEDEALSSLK